MTARSRLCRGAIVRGFWFGTHCAAGRLHTSGGWGPGRRFSTSRLFRLRPPVVRPNLSEAMALFLKQNLDLLIAKKHGIEFQ